MKINSKKYFFTERLNTIKINNIIQKKPFFINGLQQKSLLILKFIIFVIVFKRRQMPLGYFI